MHGRLASHTISRGITEIFITSSKSVLENINKKRLQKRN